MYISRYKTPINRPNKPAMMDSMYPKSRENSLSKSLRLLFLVQDNKKLYIPVTC